MAIESRVKSVKFLCPCGCGTVVSVNLAPGSGKAWGASVNEEGQISLWPSVWLQSGCRSHFIMRNSTARLFTGTLPRMTDKEYEEWWKK